MMKTKPAIRLGKVSVLLKRLKFVAKEETDQQYVHLRNRDIPLSSQPKVTKVKGETFTECVDEPKGQYLRLRNRDIPLLSQPKVTKLKGETFTECVDEPKGQYVSLRNRDVSLSSQPKVQKVKKERVECKNKRHVPAILNPDDDDLSCLFQSGDIIFAKTKGYAAWPGRIINVLKIAPLKSKYKILTKAQVLQRSKYKVEFFSTKDVYTVNGDCLYYYTPENIEIFQKNRFKGAKLMSLFQEALAEAADAC